MDPNLTKIDLHLPPLDGRLGLLLRKASRRSRRQRHSILVSLTQPTPVIDPIAIFANTAGVCRDRMLWLQPEAGFSLATVGAAHMIETTGEGRFSDTAAALEALLSEAEMEGHKAEICNPILMGGFSFEPGRSHSRAWEGYPDGRMLVPRVCVTTRRDRAWITMSAVMQPDTDPREEQREILHLYQAVIAAQADRDGHVPGGLPTLGELQSSAQWRDEVLSAAQAARRGDIRKVVLARSVTLQGTLPFECGLALRRLRTGYPSCVVFAIARDQHCFLGATPERLLKVEGREASATCLAGSYPRGEGETADRQLADALFADPKERSEHALVRGHLLKTLKHFCTDVRAPAVPSILKLPNVQHLCTPVCARVAGGQSLLRIIERLHPTPSVGGEPRELALKMIREREGLDRGWYAGPVGWLGPDGEGEFAVAIRAALIHGAQAILYAGCGIVADSDPDREYAESCIKLLPMLTALGAA